ncbi:MAG: hypothetical protein JKX97_03210 [Candidatus Lindowbacteria bacterium]|nr:hypothetical protein [Candidatus Lindowbacteria bacterium]
MNETKNKPKEASSELPNDPRLQIGVILIVLSTGVGYPVVGYVGYNYGYAWGWVAYGVTWIPFVLGAWIGGKPALDKVKTFRKWLVSKITS